MNEKNIRKTWFDLISNMFCRNQPLKDFSKLCECSFYLIGIQTNESRSENVQDKTWHTFVGTTVCDNFGPMSIALQILLDL